MKRQLITFAILTLSICLNAQTDLPILHADTDQISIQDGEILRVNYWSASSTIPLDIYKADKTKLTKVVTFISGIDSLSFELKAREEIDFIILLNGKDTCYTRLASGLNYIKSENKKEKADSISFVLSPHNNICLNGIINGKDTLKLMLHTASNSISITEDAANKIAPLKFNDPETINSWGGQGQSRFSENNSVKIGETVFENVGIWENNQTGHGTEGKIGLHYFDNKIIELNFDLNLMVVHPKIPEDVFKYKKYDLQFDRFFMLVRGDALIEQELISRKFMIHSGYSGAVLYDDHFVAKHNLAEKLSIVEESELKDSGGNVIKTLKAILPNFKIGETSFEEVPVAFFDGAVGRQKFSVLGGSILKRFNLIFDLQEAQLYLKENKLSTQSFTG